MSDIVTIREKDVRLRAKRKPDPAAYIAAVEQCVQSKQGDAACCGGVKWLIDRDSDCYRELWRRERGYDYPVKANPTRPTETHAETRDGVRFGVGDALAWAFGVMGYQVNAGCACKATQRWANERRWWEWTYPAVRRELLDRLTAEAVRRKIIRCECKGGKCTRPSWRRLVTAGIRDRTSAAWRAIKQAGGNHAHGAGDHPRHRS
jgi:hypothetical protein